MIYLDVTGACRLPLQTGIPRTTRALHALLRDARVDLKPIAWQPFLFAYTELSARARMILENPFSPEVSAGAAMQDFTLPILKAGLADLVRFRPAQVPLRTILREDDTLFITSIFPDNRLGTLQRLRNLPGRKLAIFHDAISLGDPTVPAWVRRRHVAGLRTYAAMDRVICVSAAGEDELHHWWKEHGIAPAPTQVMTWPVPFAESRPAFSPPPTGNKKILYVARLKQVKNHAVLLAACDLLWREKIAFSLELIGCEDHADDGRVILAEIERLQAAGHALHWRGHVNDVELHRAYQAASFTVFPSRREGLGLPILESFWHGRPVICSTARPMCDVGRGPGCGLVDVEKPEAVAAAMRELLLDDAANLSLARQAHGRPLRTWADYKNDLWPLLHLTS